MALDEEFVDLYGELAQEVELAHYEFLPERLLRWFDLLDTTAGVAEVTRALQAQCTPDYEQWRRNLQMSGELPRPWHADPDRALGIQLCLFRFFSKAAAEEISQFGFVHFRAGRDVNDNAHAVIEQVFMPMTRDLRRYLNRQLKKGSEPDREAPASDRMVPLNHNTPLYKATVEAAATLEYAVQGANEFDDPDEKQQRVAEVSALRRLLQAPRVMIQPVVALLRPLVQDSRTVLKNMVITAALTGFLSLLGRLLEIVWPWVIPAAN
jgi:hypothetical protein